MNSHTQTHSTNSVQVCQNCKNSFGIEPEDFDFYKKIKVPTPTWCPKCRLVRRMSFQNERTFYRRPCDLCKEETITMFSKDTEHPVFCSRCWWSDKWDPKSYFVDLDFSKPFFQQFLELRNKIPALGLNNIYSTLENSSYCNICSELKNCYLLFNSDYNEQCFYSTYLERSKSSSDLYMSDMCERCYMSTNLFKCYQVFFSNRCNECFDIWFSDNLQGCSNCFGCINLRNKQYYIFNIPYSKEEYFKKLKSLNLESRESLSQIRNQVKELHSTFPRRYMEGLKNLNCTGDYVFNSKNIKESYEITESENCKYCQFLLIAGTKDSYDYTMWGLNANLIYECLGVGNNSTNIKFCFESWSASSNLEYCWNIFNSSHNLFGCIGLKSSSYCILNKQYTKEEYEELIAKIKQQMVDMPYTDNKGRTYGYGEFFPPEISYYSYNESVAQKYFPETQSSVIENGFKWKTDTSRDYKITIQNQQIPDSVLEMNESIVNDVIECKHNGKNCGQQCTTAFRITKEEFAFYKTLGLPLPDICHNCRHYSMIESKTKPIGLYHRKCMNKGCTNEFETSYSPDRPEVIYCEDCYQKEIL